MTYDSTSPPERALELAALKRKIDLLGKVYAGLFALAVAIVVVDGATRAPLVAHLPWAIALAAAVATRIARQRLDARYESILFGR